MQVIEVRWSLFKDFLLKFPFIGAFRFYKSKVYYTPLHTNKVLEDSELAIIFANLHEIIDLNSNFEKYEDNNLILPYNFGLRVFHPFWTIKGFGK